MNEAIHQFECLTSFSILVDKLFPITLPVFSLSAEQHLCGAQGLARLA